MKHFCVYFEDSVIFKQTAVLVGNKTAIKKTSCGILARGLDMICAKDGWDIFINKKVMAISVRHDFYGRMYEFH